jgi:RND family efflux transporter MFP subunit
VKKILLATFGLLVLCNAAAQAQDEANTAGVTNTADGLTVRGLIKPVQEAMISSQISARITSMPFRPGDRFKKGDVLVGFDCAFYIADLASKEAEHESRKKKFENNKQLLALNATSEIEVSISESDVEIAGAEMRMRAIKAEECKIKAPYNGRVIDVIANEYETVAQDKELLSILNDQNLEIELIVPSNWLIWLKPDQSFVFLVDETGSEYKAKITKIGAVIDPVSQTIKLTGTIEGDAKQVLAGMSGTARFIRPGQ